MRGLFVTGTDTGVGKTILSAALLGAMSAAGEPVVAHKPVLTGLAEPPEGAWPRDHELLGELAGMRPEEVAPLRFSAPASPHLAAALEGRRDRPGRAGGERSRRGDPICRAIPGRSSWRESAACWCHWPTATPFATSQPSWSCLSSSRHGQGWERSTTPSSRLEAARASGLRVAAVVLNPWPAEPGALELSNLETIREEGGVEVMTLPPIPPGGLSALAAAGEKLPWRHWLEGMNGDGSPLN